MVYLIIILISLIIILFNFMTDGFTNINNTFENFSNAPSIKDNIKITPSISKNNNDIIDENNMTDNLEKDITEIMEKSIPAPSVLNESSYLDEIENKDLVLSDFYPTPKLVSKKSQEEILKFAFSTDLFHQILPIYKKGYMGLISFEKRINGLYYTEDLKSKDWQLLPNSIPKGMLRPIFMTYDKDRKLLGIFEENIDGDYILTKYHLYKKKDLGLGCKWEHIEKSRIMSILYDEDDKLIGLDNKGRFYKKTNKNINSEWENINLNFEHIPMRKLIYQHNTNVMFGLGNDFRIYKKQFSDWKNSEWDVHYGPTKKSLLGSVRDIFYDYDNKLCGLSRIGLVKQEDIDYLSDFKIYENYEKKTLNINQILYCITGIKNLPVYNNLNNNINEMVIDGKKLSDYKFKDKRLNEFVKFRMNLKKQCKKIKNLKIQEDNENLGEQEDIRNEKLQNILNQQKDTIDNLLDTIESLKQKSFSE